MHIYAIGDIHGHLDQLHQMHDRIAADMAVHGAGAIVHVGDLVDRGANAAGVIDHLLRGQKSGENWVVLKGNHDRMFVGFLDDPAYHDPGLRTDLGWLHPKLGGAATLHSYGVKNPGDRPLAPVHAESLAAVPQSHRDYLHALPTSHRQGEVLFVHAGIRPGIALAEQSETDLLWIRQAFLTDPCDHGPLIVHGHTVVDTPSHYGNRVNIDSGAAYGGPLSAVVIEGRAVFHLTATGRVRLAVDRPQLA